MQKYSYMQKEQVLRALKTSNIGLAENEARARNQKFGLNKLKEERKKSIINLFFSQFKDVMTILLIAAGFISGAVAAFSGEGKDLTDTVIILCIIVMNAAVGTAQQYKADKAIEKLKSLNVVNATVLRDGKERVIDGKYLTVGDVIFINEGDVIPADCRLLSGNNLKCDEATLTGESLSVEKNDEFIPDNKTPLGGMENTLFSSTYVVQGNGTAVVTGIGMNTEIGTIANMLSDGEKLQTPLEKALETLGKIISVFVLATVGLVFVLGVFLREQTLVSSFMTAVALAVAAIPEGLPAVVTVIMAIGVQKMSAKNIVIRKLQSVETLGSCNYICTDKTGTLTQNKMKVSCVMDGDGVYERGDECKSELLLACMSACNNVKGDRGAYIGDSTEIALRNYCDEQEYFNAFVRLDEKPFNSAKKVMYVLSEHDGRRITFVKGAPDKLIKLCNAILINGKELPLNESITNKILRINDAWSDGALRVLGFAYRLGNEIADTKLVFLGLAGMIDQIKPGVKEAVKRCKTAGITTVMITGDHVRTAFAIAKKVGIAEDFNQVVSGDELDALPKAERANRIRNCRVFARVTPKHKNIIVKTLQSGGNVVAMTGDGINDAPSIKSADIGIAMGKTGTEVTKNVADMVVADDNFTTIVSAVAEGRRISSNVKKTVWFFISTNVAEVLSLLIATIFFSGEKFLLSTQLLWINLITDSFPVLALGVEKDNPENMTSKPVRAEKAMFSKTSVAFMLFFGVYITAVTVGVYAFSLFNYGASVATTMTFLVISFLELFHSFNVRSEYTSLIKCGFFSNKTLIWTLLLAIAVNVIACATPLGALLGVVPLNAKQWVTVFALSLSVIAVGEIYKFVVRKLRKKKIQ